MNTHLRADNSDLSLDNNGEVIVRVPLDNEDYEDDGELFVMLHPYQIEHMFLRLQAAPLPAHAKTMAYMAKEAAVVAKLT